MIKPKKVFLNFNLISRDYKNESQTTTQTRIHTQSHHQSFSEVKEPQKQQQISKRTLIQQYCYLIYLDKVDDKMDDYCLKFKLKDLFYGVMRKEMRQMFDDELYDLFQPYTKLIRYLDIPNHLLKAFQKIKFKSDIIELYFQFKDEGQELNVLIIINQEIQQMFEYFFVPDKQLSLQMIADIKRNLDYETKIGHLLTTDGWEIKHLYQIGWNPPTIYCCTNLGIYQQKKQFVIDKLMTYRKLQELQDFKSKLFQSEETSIHLQKLNEVRQIQRINLKLFNNLIGQTPKLPKLQKPNQQEIKENEKTIDHLENKQIKLIQQKYPKLKIHQIYTYYVDFKSLCLVSQHDLVKLEVFLHFCPAFKDHSQIEIDRILRSLGVSMVNQYFEWNTFLHIRTLIDDCASPQQIIDFIIGYFEPSNGIIDEESIQKCLLDIGIRLNDQQRKQIKQNPQQNVEKDVQYQYRMIFHNVQEGNTFADKFVISTMRWMTLTKQVFEGRLNTNNMLKEGIQDGNNRLVLQNLLITFFIKFFVNSQFSLQFNNFNSSRLFLDNQLLQNLKKPFNKVIFLCVKLLQPQENKQFIEISLFENKILKFIYNYTNNLKLLIISACKQFKFHDLTILLLNILQDLISNQILLEL
ncbi:hypothetical protein pb186bvf_003365 [Paramecium bursaria]